MSIPREILILGRFFERRFQPLSLEDFSQTNRDRVNGVQDLIFVKKKKKPRNDKYPYILS